jgi:hypothetical protein
VVELRDHPLPDDHSSAELDPTGQDDATLDLAAVHADDELLDALGAPDLWTSLGVSEGPDLDDRIVAMFAAWRSEVQTEPEHDLVSVEQAMAVLAAAQPKRHRRRLVPLSAAAALLVVLVSGVAVGAKDAEPGDTLWDVSKVLYSERAHSVEAAVEVKGKLASAKVALSDGRARDAVTDLAKARVDLPAVRDQEGRDQLAAQQQVLATQALDSLDATAVPNPATAQTPPLAIPPSGTTTTLPKPSTVKPIPPRDTTTSTPPPTTTTTTVSPPSGNSAGQPGAAPPGTPPPAAAPAATPAQAPPPANVGAEGTIDSSVSEVLSLVSTVATLVATVL